jgi:hypothetical protein
MLASLVGRVDSVVLVDGPYQGLSDERVSPPDNYAVFRLYDQLLSMQQVDAVEAWPSEAEKRQAAADAAPPGDLLLIDSDEALLDPIYAGTMCCAFQDGSPTSVTRRVFPKGSVWGPHHARVTLAGEVLWDPEWVRGPETGYDFRTLHTPGEKRTQLEQEAYDRDIRPLVEGH